MRKIMYSALVVFGAAGIATAAVMSGSSSEECSMSKRACSAKKEMKSAAVQTNDASMKIVPVANMEVTEKAVTEKVVTEKSEKSDCIFREMFGCGD